MNRVVVSALGLVVLSLFQEAGNAADIGFGTIKAIKVYDFASNKSVRVYLDDDATNKDEAACDGVGNISFSSHSEEVANRMLSMALAADAAGRKVRIYSSTGSCEIDLVVISDIYI